MGPGFGITGPATTRGWAKQPVLTSTGMPRDTAASSARARVGVAVAAALVGVLGVVALVFGAADGNSTVAYFAGSTQHAAAGLDNAYYRCLDVQVHSLVAPHQPVTFGQQGNVADLLRASGSWLRAAPPADARFPSSRWPPTPARAPATASWSSRGPGARPASVEVRVGSGASLAGQGPLPDRRCECHRRGDGLADRPRGRRIPAYVAPGGLALDGRPPERAGRCGALGPGHHRLSGHRWIVDGVVPRPGGGRPLVAAGWRLTGRDGRPSPPVCRPLSRGRREPTAAPAGRGPAGPRRPGVPRHGRGGPGRLGIWCLRGLRTPLVGLDARLFWFLRSGWWLWPQGQALANVREHRGRYPRRLPAADQFDRGRGVVGHRPSVRTRSAPS